MSRLSTRSYYDAFAAGYERERHLPYHRMLDDLELELVERYGAGRSIVEVGCGTGLLLERAARFASTAVGIDLSGEMLARARSRGLVVAQGSATRLPLASASFDLAYSFKVLAHVEDLPAALAELARVVRPGGWVLAELYNARSLRRLVKRLPLRRAVAPGTTDHDVYTRYDDRRAIERALPPELSWRATRGIRIITPAAFFHRVPLFGRALRAAEHALADLPAARHLGGFLVVCAQRS